MPSTLARRLDKIEAVVGTDTALPDGVRFTVATWSDLHEMHRLLDAADYPKTGVYRHLPPPDAGEAEGSAARQRVRDAALRDLAAAPPLPVSAAPLTRYARQVQTQAVRAGAVPVPVSPFVYMGRGAGSILPDGEHVGAVTVTPAFAAEWAAEWERGLAGEPMPNLPGRMSLYWRL